MVPALRLGISPLPKPLGLAFAKTVLGRSLPLPVGLLFHVAYVTAWSVVYVALFRHALTLVNALLLGLVLWLLVLFVFFPIVGWGVLGLAVSPKLIVASLVPPPAVCRVPMGPVPDQLRSDARRGVRARLTVPLARSGWRQISARHYVGLFRPWCEQGEKT